ncbi:MAG: hypothetical protein ACF8MJ_11910 [Phycisphaerales bacterium JB050]
MAFSPIPRSWQRSPAGGLPSGAIVARVGVAAVVIGLAAFAAAFVMPLRQVAPASPGVAVDAADWGPVPDGRGTDPRMIASLSEAYLFTPGRRPFAELEPVEGSAEPTPRVVDAAPESAVPEQTRTDDGGVRVVRVESPDAVGGDIQKSYREVILRGIHSNRSGRLVALIDFTGGQPGAAAVRVMEGDSFTESKHPEQDWRVVAIDPVRNRVVIERRQRRLALALFGTGPADLSPLVIAPEVGEGAASVSTRIAADGTVIVERRPEDVIAELRQEPSTDPAGGKPITADDLFELLRAVRDLDRYGERARDLEDPDGR